MIKIDMSDKAGHEIQTRAVSEDREKEKRVKTNPPSLNILYAVLGKNGFKGLPPSFRI